MSLLKFELKKLIKQKKIIWLLLIVVLFSSALYIQKSSQESTLREDMHKKTESYNGEIGRIQGIYRGIMEQSNLTEIQQQQYDYLQKMLFSVIAWGNYAKVGNWEEVLVHEGEFYSQLEQYEALGGQPFTSLQGMEREIAIEKNTWLRENNLVYEEEENPTSPHLFLKDSTSILLGLVGILILVLFFGNSITEEKEENTWLTLRTQPMSKGRIFTAKYITSLVVLILFVVMVFAIGLIIPSHFSNHEINLQYPQVLIEEDTFTIISTGNYLLRSLILFICASITTLGMSLLLNRWAKSTFTVLLFSVTAIALGYFITEIILSLQSPLNPFYYLHFKGILRKLPNDLDWLYPVFAIVWAFCLYLVIIFAPDKEGSSKSETGLHLQFKENKRRTVSWLYNLLRFEWRKLRREGLYTKSTLIIVMVIIVSYSYFSHQTRLRESENLHILEQRVQDWEESVVRLDNSMVDRMEYVKKYESEFYDQTKRDWEDTRRLYEDLGDMTQKGLEAFVNEEWTEFNRYLLYYNKYRNGEFATSISVGHFYFFQPFLLDASLAEKQWLIEHKVKPIFPSEFVPIVNDWYQPSEYIVIDQRVDNSGLFSLYLFFENYIYFVPLALFLFLLGGGLASERGKKNTLNFLKTQPLSEKNIYLGKILNAKLVTIISCLIFILLLVIIGTVYNRFGDWKYPILHYDAASTFNSPDYTGHTSFALNQTRGFHFIPLGHYLLQALALFTSITIFFFSLSILLSIFFKRTMGVLASTVLIGISGYWFSGQFLTETAHLSPFTYLNIPKILNGEIGMYLDNPSVNFLTGSIVNLLLALILVGIGLILLSKKDSASSLGRKWVKRVTVKKIQNNAG